MKYKIFFLFVILAVVGLEFLTFYTDSKPVNTVTVATSTPKVASKTPVKKIKEVLAVPYVSEAPENIWSGSWVNACEESSIMMVDEYYKGTLVVSTSSAKAYLLNLFAAQRKLYGSDANSDASRMITMIEDHANFDAELVIYPTIEEIKAEIDAGRPVISLHRGFDLKNPNVPFLATGSSYHTIVIFGYDDLAQNFITHDPGDQYTGRNYLYSYETIMNSLHDYNHVTHLADGVPTVIFTARR
jgi:uncharacterized protein YvpB